VILRTAPSAPHTVRTELTNDRPATGRASLNAGRPVRTIVEINDDAKLLGTLKVNRPPEEFVRDGYSGQAAPYGRDRRLVWR
jgi:hypothetical protein